MKNNMGCCGLDCEKCDAYIATVNDDNTLRDKTAKLWSEYNGVEITREMINCMGCCVDGVKTPYCDSMCGIRKCVNEKGFKTCADCADTESCETVKPVFENSDEALNNINEMKLHK